MQNRQTQPRSILKHSGKPHSSSTTTAAPPTAVRFPSSPQLSTVGFTHCPLSYDRSPIVVAANSCALPARHCRNYDLSPTSQSWGNHAHPSAILAHSNGSYGGSLAAPPLIPDEGSSEESDGIASPPPELVVSTPHSAQKPSPSQAHLYSAPLSHPPISQSSGSDFDLHQYPTHHLYSHHSSSNSGAPSDYSLSFLPYAPSKPPSPSKHRREKKDSACPTAMQAQSAFTSGWGVSDESSCLGGF